MRFSKWLLMLGASLWTFGVQAAMIQIPAPDGLSITAQTYFQATGKTPPIIVLFHQANASRGEFAEIAPKLNALGYHCIAVDQRAGRSMNGVENHTASLAKQQNRSTASVVALQDMQAVLEYVQQQYPGAKVLVMGSSYSGALALKLAAEHPKLFDGVIAFSPAEYFSQQGKPKTWITDSARYIRMPVFISSAPEEYPLWSGIFQNIPTRDKHAYLPSGEGAHGASALWPQTEDQAMVWGALETFLEQYFPPKPRGS